MKKLIILVFLSVCGLAVFASGRAQRIDCSTMSNNDTRQLCRQNNQILRLLKQTAPSRARMESGFLEVQYNGVWYGVCDDGFDSDDAEVACRMMGKSYSSYSTDQRHPAGRDHFLLDDLDCEGNETSLFDCKHSGIGEENCSDNEYVAVSCI